MNVLPFILILTTIILKKLLDNLKNNFIGEGTDCDTSECETSACETD
jgi:hypothetical protein